MHKESLKSQINTITNVYLAFLSYNALFITAYLTISCMS